MKKKRSRKLTPPEPPRSPSDFVLAADLVKEATQRLDKGLTKNGGPVQLHSSARFLKLTLASCEQELRVLDTVAPILRMATTPLEQATLQPFYDAAFGVAPSSHADATGMHFTFQCDTCAQRLTIVVPWIELVMLSTGQVPPGWVYSHRHGTVHPELRCHQCGNENIMTMGLDEATRHVRAGVHAGYVSTGKRRYRKRPRAHKTTAHRAKGHR